MVVVFIKRYLYPRFVNRLFGINYRVKEELIVLFCSYFHSRAF